MTTRSRDATVVVAGAGVWLTLVAFTTPLATLVATADGLGAGPGAQAWILAGMSLGCAAGLMAAGSLGDERGRRRVFVVGALLLALASVLGGLATAAWWLVVMRVVQGLGGAAVMACGLGLVGRSFPDGRARSRATAAWGAALGAGVATGPLVASGLAALGGWRLPYLTIALVAVGLAVAGQVLLAESRADRPRPIDVPGTVLLPAAVAALLAGLVQGRSDGPTPGTIVLLVGAAVLAAGFVVVEHRSPAPMLDLGLFRRPDFTGATVAALGAGAGVLSLSNFVPTVLERGLGLGALAASVVLLAWSGTSAVTAYAARWFPESVTPRTLLVGGLVGIAVGQVALLGLDVDSSPARLVPGLLIAGAANGVLNAALGRQAVASVPPDRAAMGSGANNTARYVGSAVGITVCAVLVAGAGAGPAAAIAGWDTDVIVTAIISLACAVIALVVRAPSRVPTST
ncbi:MFS transporter [Actinomycetospora termitidis]|uniref:MFS transporter n=1 Tax=Actinomycetospora termitidis TaxID=3053470 RepID=A0ABT7MGB3_9PSEU|nr:MFS transporter [Actinomycetospora sp. Odt1-22]MDL5159695.1 MFS transporter [Actinomycetospora sp. Odt1-22]